MASALRGLDVPVVAIVDIDILSDRAKFIKLFEALGGDKADVDLDLQTVITSVGVRRGQLTGPELAVELGRIADEFQKHKDVPKELRNELSKLNRAGSNWGRLKEDGFRALVDGPAIQAFERLARSSKQVGLLINPEGELEGFCRQVSRSRKSEWLADVLTRDFGRDEGLEEARKFASVIRAAMSKVLHK